MHRSRSTMPLPFGSYFDYLWRMPARIHCRSFSQRAGVYTVMCVYKTCAEDDQTKTHWSVTYVDFRHCTSGPKALLYNCNCQPERLCESCCRYAETTRREIIARVLQMETAMAEETFACRFISSNESAAAAAAAAADVALSLPVIAKPTTWGAIKSNRSRAARANLNIIDRQPVRGTTFCTDVTCGTWPR